MECLRPVMVIMNTFFKKMDCHPMQYPITLQEIYELYLKDKCTPQIISHTAKYKIYTPQVMKVSRSISEEEEILKDPMINAVRIGRQYDNERQHDNTSYTPDRCKVCGLTQKECHQVWKTIHDPNDVKKCLFRGPEFITDKHIREKLLQYNLKYNDSKEP